MDIEHSVTLSLTGKESLLTAVFNPVLNLSSHVYEIALLNLFTYNSIPNITSTNNNFYFYNFIGDLEILDKVTLKHGTYELHDIFSELLREIDAYNSKNDNNNSTNKKKIRVQVQISYNKTLSRCQIKSNVVMDFKLENSIGSVLGFAKTEIDKNTLHTAEHAVNIQSVNVLCVDCNISGGSFHNGEPTHTLHQFWPVVPPGYKIVETPNSPIYMSVVARYVSELSVAIRDQDGNLVDFDGEEITVRLHLRKIR